MTLVLASLVTATAVLGAWTLAILRVKRRLESAAGYPLSACQRARPEPLVEAGAVRRSPRDDHSNCSRFPRRSRGRADCGAGGNFRQRRRLCRRPWHVLSWRIPRPMIRPAIARPQRVAVPARIRTAPFAHFRHAIGPR